MITERHKRVSEIEGYETFSDYSIDVAGNIWSHKFNKCRKISFYKAKRRNITYYTTQIIDENGKKGVFYVHRLVALAFLPNPTGSWGIEHIDGDLSNNHLDNLRWICKKTEDGNVDDTLFISKDLSDYIKLVHRACITKGVPVPTTYEFFHGILNESLEEYIQRYGLKKIMYQIMNS